MAYKKNVQDLISTAVQTRGLADRKAMKLHQVRMTDTQWQILAIHFEQQGLSTSAGIRQVLNEYMQKQGLK